MFIYYSITLLGYIHGVNLHNCSASDLIILPAIALPDKQIDPVNELPKPEAAIPYYAIAGRTGSPKIPPGPLSRPFGNGSYSGSFPGEDPGRFS
jgi:hypothetical protein